MNFSARRQNIAAGHCARWFGAANAITIISVEGMIALLITALVWPEVR